MGLYSKFWRLDRKTQLQQNLQIDLHFAWASKFSFQTSIPRGPLIPPLTVGPTIFFYFSLFSISLPIRGFSSCASAQASLADAAAAAVTSDLTAFLRSDSDEVPQTLKQISKLAASPEASASATALSGALAAGVLRGYYRAAATPGSCSGAAVTGAGAALSDRVLDRVLSPDGERLASAVAGSFGRNLVLAFYSAPSQQPSTADDSPESWVDALTTRRCQRAIRSWVEVFTATAVGVFIDKTIHINTYDQLFAAATNPAYGARLQELFVALCSASVGTLVKTSHGVLSGANSAAGNADASATSGSNGGVAVGERWVETVSSALVVPTNRKLVLDLTGRATFEAVRSFLEFVLWKLRAGGDATVEAGLYALRHMSDRSVVIATICVALCLHILNGTWLLVPA